MINENATPLFVDDECEPLCESVDILAKRISIESGEERLVIKVNSKANGIPFEVSREQFVKQSFFNKLTLHGLSVIECEKSYPMFYRDHLHGAFDQKKCCLACSKCTELMRAKQVSGCAVFNEYYRELYKTIKK